MVKSLSMSRFNRGGLSLTSGYSVIAVNAFFGQVVDIVLISAISRETLTSHKNRLTQTHYITRSTNLEVIE